MNTRPPLWLQKICYRYSMPYRHDVDRGYREQYEMGRQVGWNAAWTEAMKHMPWYERTTDPLQQTTPKRQTVPLAKNGDYVRMVREQPGRTIHTQLLFAMGKVQLAQLQANMREQENKEDRHA